MNQCINILFQSDNNFAFIVGVALVTILVNVSKEVFSAVYYLASGLTGTIRAKFLSHNERKIVTVPSRWRNGRHTQDISPDSGWMLYDLEKQEIVGAHL